MATLVMCHSWLYENSRHDSSLHDFIPTIRDTTVRDNAENSDVLVALLIFVQFSNFAHFLPSCTALAYASGV
jgi:hypothetical protein